MPLYFAYGSNMDVAAMTKRCPATRVIGPARLARHRLLINRDGYATVLRHPTGEVHGLLFDLALSDMSALDRYEGIAAGLYSKVQQPVISAAGPRKAMIYVARSSEPGTARPGYLEGVIAAARSAGLPPKYIAGLAMLGGAPAAAGEAPAQRFRALGQKSR